MKLGEYQAAKAALMKSASLDQRDSRFITLMWVCDNLIAGKAPLLKRFITLMKECDDLIACKVPL